MKYNFETARERKGVGSSKWDEMRDARGAYPEQVIPLSVADMEFMAAPEIMAALADTVRYGMWGYSEPSDSYYEAVKRWMKKQHGWELDKESVVQTSGVVQGLYTAVRAFTKPGDGVLIQTPVYYPFYRAVKLNGRTILENPLTLMNGRYEMDFDDLEEKAKKAKLFILCSPHNPVGRVWRREELLRTAKICLENHVLMLVDEIHADLVYPGHKHTAFGTLEKKYTQNCLIGTAASKTFSLAALMCANYIIPNPALRERFDAQVDLDGCYTYNIFGMNALETAYTECDGWYQELLGVLKGNYDYFRRFMKEHFPKVWVADLEGTYLAWADFQCFGMKGRQLEQFLRKEAGLWLDSGYLFGEAADTFERFNLACPEQVLEASLNRLYKAAKKAGIAQLLSR